MKSSIRCGAMRDSQKPDNHPSPHIVTMIPRGLALAFASLVAGCSAVYQPPASELPGKTTSAVAGTRWVREVAPFEVIGPNGIPYDIPFLGGFNVPRPQLVDIDSDGDQDLFIQEMSDQLLFFEHEDTPEGPMYRWRPRMFADLSIGEWYRFVDIDNDGDQDLLAEEPFSYVRLYRNVGGPLSPDFELIADTLRDNRGAPIFSDRQNIPNAADIDCDGMLDLLIGRLVGTVTRYEAVSGVGTTASQFRHITDRFEGIELVGSPDGIRNGNVPTQRFGPLGAGPAPFSGGLPTMRHGANTMALADIDGDGDVDFFWGDFFEPGLLFIENRGSCTEPDLGAEPQQFPLNDPLETSGYNAPTFGDMDGDGDLDLLIGVLGGAYNPNMTTADNLLHLTQNADDGFQLQTRRFISQIDVGSESVPSFVDLDGDGDLDLLVGNRIDPEDSTTSHVLRFENVGTPTAPEFHSAGRIAMDGSYHNAPAFGDLDGDGDLDIILGTWRADLRYIENTGSRRAPRFQLKDSVFVQLPRGSNATPALGDIDADGDLDLIVGESDGTLNLFENTGDRSIPRFQLISEEYRDIDIGRRSFPALIDIDDDGDLDLAVGTETNGIVYYQNQGNVSHPAFTRVESPFPAPESLPRLSTPTFGDVDGDGDTDLVVGGTGGGAYFFRHDSPR